MDIIPLNVNYNHKNLVNNPPFITNNPVHEKLAEHKIDFNNNELRLFKNEWAKDQKDNNFLTTYILAATSTVTLCGLYIYKKSKAAISKLK